MHADPGLPYLRELIIFLVAAGIVVPLLHRLRVSPVLGYLMVGYVVGPFGLALFAAELPWLQALVISDLAGVQKLAELGVVFLLFVIGLELSFERLWALRRLVFGLGSLQVVASALGIGAVAFAFGNSAEAATLVGACFALSSTAIVMQILAARRQSDTPLGRTSFSILLMQDLAVVPILFLVGVLAAENRGGVGFSLALAFGKALLVVATIYLIGRVLLRPLMRLVARTRSPEMFTAAVLLIAVGSAVLTSAAGLSMALGAFLAGLLLAETEFRHAIEVDIAPFKGLLLGLFFVSIGMGLDARVIWLDALPLLATVASLMVGKALIIGLLCLAFRLPRALALESGLLLGQAGEFAFVVLGLAGQFALLTPQATQFLLIVAGLSMFATPLVAAMALRVAARLAAHDAARSELDVDKLAGIDAHVVIAGYGRVGRALARVLDVEGIAYIALDLDAEEVARARSRGLPVFYGDASRLDILKRARLDQARVLVITMDNATAAEHVVRAVREFAAQLPIYARARDSHHARSLLRHGATEVVPETVEASLQLAARVLAGTGMADAAVDARIASEREIELRRLRD